MATELNINSISLCVHKREKQLYEKDEAKFVWTVATKAKIVDGFFFSFLESLT